MVILMNDGDVFSKMNGLCFPYKVEEYDNKNFVEVCSRVYSKLFDEISKRVFSNRLLYSLTYDTRYMRNLILDTEEGKKFWNIVKGKSPYIYGAGRFGQRLQTIFNDIAWKGFIDKNKTGSLNGLKIFRIDEVEICNDVVISIQEGYDSVKKELLELGFQENNLIAIGEFDKRQTKSIYFEEDILPRHVDSASFFVDVGAYDGKDTLNYGRFYDLDKSELHAFVYEPDVYNFKECSRLLFGYENVHLKNACLGSENGTVSFSVGNGVSSSISTSGEDNVLVNRLSDEVKDKHISYIKMDVEGMEKTALIGAEDIIRLQRPLLAISVYHKRNDIWDLPNTILDMCSDYRLYLRHYKICGTDTVLYCVPN